MSDSTPTRPDLAQEPSTIKRWRSIPEADKPSWWVQEVLEYVDSLILYIRHQDAEIQRITRERDALTHEPDGQIRANLSNDAIRSILDKAKEYKDERDHALEQIERLKAENAELVKVLSYLDCISGDDFCEDLDMQAAFQPEKLTETEKAAHKKLSAVYQAAHGFDKTNTCYGVHDDWRKQTLEAADALRQALSPAAPERATAEPKGDKLS